MNTDELAILAIAAGSGRARRPAMGGPARLLAACLAIAACGYPTPPAQAARCERQQVARVPLRDDGGFLSIPASIAGVPVRLMIDTGSDAGLITPEAVQHLALATDTGARIRMHGTGGAGHSAGLAQLAGLTIGTLRLDGALMPVGELPGAPNLTPAVVGFLGGDVLSQFDLDIDVPHGILSLWRIGLPSLACAPPPVWSRAFATVPLRAHGVRLSLAATLDGHPVSALLDTGARSRIVSEAAARRAGVALDQLAADPGGITSGIDMREQIYHWHRFATLSIGNETVRSPVLTVMPLSEPFDILLGSDWFVGREVWVSYATKQIFFQTFEPLSKRSSSRCGEIAHLPVNISLLTGASFVVLLRSGNSRNLCMTGTISGSTAGSGFHLTAKPWTSSGVTASQLLSRIKGELAFFVPYQASNGNFVDPVDGNQPPTNAANFAYGAALLTSTGDATYLPQALKAMDYATATYASGGSSNTSGPEFSLAPLVNAYMLLKASGLVSQSELSQWAKNLTPFYDTPNQLNSNWSTYAMNGAWMQYKAGLVSHSTAVSEIENIWTSYQSARDNNGTDGLYVDGNQSPTSLSVEAVGRGNFTALISEGYDGPSASAIAALVQEGGENSLQLLDPSGQVPAGGRTDDHLFVDAGYQAIDQALAKMDAQSNPALAAQYQRAADLTFQEMSRWQQSNGSFSVTKNQYPASERVGYQNASDLLVYNAGLVANTATAYQSLTTSSVAEQPTAAEIGGFVYTTPATFAATFANAGGTAIEIETQGRSSPLLGQTWNALGIDRIGTTGWDTRLGPSDGVYDSSTGEGVTFAPTWLSGSNWDHLADHASNYGGTVTTQLETPVLTRLTVVWAPTSGSGPTFTEKLTITPDGILSQTTESGSSDAFGMTLPLMLDDGKTTLTQTIGNGIASVSYPGGSSAENFLTLNAGTTLTKESPIQSTYGDITPIRAVASGSAEQDTFVYPSSSGQPQASSVLSSFSQSGGNYSSDLGWVNGDLYSGRTSAGGYGSSIALSGSGNPDAVFSQAVDFILQVSNGVITSVETDAAVTATIEGTTYNLSAYTPQSVSGGSPSPTPPPAPGPSISLAALGTAQEASPGAGATVTETITTTGLSGTIYDGVYSKAGSLESIQPLTLAKTGKTSFQVHLASSGDYVVAANKLSSPTVTAKSSAVTITDPAPSPAPPSGPAVVTVPKPATLVAGQDSFTGTVTKGTPGVVKFAWHATTTGETATSGDMVTATKQANGTYTATLTVDHPGQAGYFYVAVGSTVTDEWSIVPSAAKASASPAFIAGTSTVVLPASGAVVLGGNTLTDGDQFDVRAAMAQTSWNGSTASLGLYLSSSTASNGQDLQILLHPTGGSASSVLATFTGAAHTPNALASFEKDAILH